MVNLNPHLWSQYRVFESLSQYDVAGPPLRSHDQRNHSVFLMFVIIHLGQPKIVHCVLCIRQTKQELNAMKMKPKRSMLVTVHPTHPRAVKVQLRRQGRGSGGRPGAGEGLENRAIGGGQGGKRYLLCPISQLLVFSSANTTTGTDVRTGSHT